MLRLLVIHGQEEQVHPVPEEMAKLGSDAGNDIVLRFLGVSRRHALIRPCQGGVEVVDLGSKNGLFVENLRVKRAVLTPGVRVQIGRAWLQLEEVPSSEEALALLAQSSEAARATRLPATASVAPEEDPRDLPPHHAALALAFHVAEAGAGLPGGRADLLARVKATLKAEAFMVFERRRRGKLHILEHEGEFIPRTELISSLAGDTGSSFPGHVLLRQVGPLLLAGRVSWFLGARFAEESLAREGWRKDLLRFLAYRFFLPVRSLDEFNASEARRVLALVGGNKRRAATLLGISPGTLYMLLSRGSQGKR